MVLGKMGGMTEPVASPWFAPSREGCSPSATPPACAMRVSTPGGDEDDIVGRGEECRRAR